MLGILNESSLGVCVVFWDIFMCFHSAYLGYFSTCSFFLWTLLLGALPWVINAVSGF